MEHSLLTPHPLTLSEGIPLRMAAGLVQGGRYHDANISGRFGSDRDVKVINRMEQDLGAVSPATLEKRIAADFCCIWRYDYPRRIHDICAIIGGRTHQELRLHYQVCPNRRAELTQYANALKGWLSDVAPDDAAYYAEGDATARKVYGLLGKKEPLKELLAERTFIGLSTRFINCSYWGRNEKEPVSLLPYTASEVQNDWHNRMSDVETAIRREMGSAAGNFLCEVGGAAEPACHFKFVRRVDVLVSSIGCLEWRGNLPPKDSLIKGRRRVTAQYLEALRRYWEGKGSEHDDTEAEQIYRDIESLLGRKDDEKRWIVASLWKNIAMQTEHHAFPMKRWVEFVGIAEQYLSDLETR